MSVKGLMWKSKIIWENLTTDRRIRFTWGSGYSEDGYTVFLRMRPFISVVYEPVIFDLKSCYEAQQQTQRLNLALKRWAPRLLNRDAELPGVGFQYPKPEEKKAVANA